MYDVFYLNETPGLFEFERKAKSIQDAAAQSRTNFFWIIDQPLYDPKNFDFFWKPIPSQRIYNHGFSDQWSRDLGIYLYIKNDVESNMAWTRIRAKRSLRNWKILHDIDLNSFDFSWHPSKDEPPYIYVFGNQWYPAEVMPTIEYHTPGATERKYLNNAKCRLAADTTNWIIPEGITEKDFDFSWKPEYTEETRYDNQPYIYQFSSQWQKDGGPRYEMPGATEVKYVDMIRTKVAHETDIFFIDKGNARADYYFAKIKAQFPYAQRTRFSGTFLDTARRCANKANTDKFWVLSSETNYDNFDLTWHDSSWQKGMNHIFMSLNHKWTETMLLNKYDLMNSGWCKEIHDLPNLNYVKDQYTNVLVEDRLNIIPYHGKDDIVTCINETLMTNNRALLIPKATKIDVNQLLIDMDTWDPKNVVILSEEGSTLLVPKHIQKYDLKSVYDYPSIIEAEHQIPEVPLDIIFISNKEPIAEDMHNHLVLSVPHRMVHRIDGINDRSKALKAAAEKSTTEWFFGVNAKLEVNIDFDWTWQPEYLENPKHYIFTAVNPVNKLMYGHMAMVAYNKKLVLETENVELDFTQAQPHEVIPIVSGIARYNEDPYMAWRTAFREYIKLLYYQKVDPQNETSFRINCWRSRASGKNANWVVSGVVDAQRYFDEVSGDLNKLKQSYSWFWLKNFFENMHGKLD